MSTSSRSVTTGEFFLYPERCTACMSCILACSLHHAQRFDRKAASIEVSVLGKERKTCISIHKTKQGERQACDYCERETEPLCVKYCAPKAIIWGGRVNEDH